MPTLVNPTAKQVAKTVQAEITAANARKHSHNRHLDGPTVAAEVAKAVTAMPQGAYDTHGGTAASSYPARTVALAVAWFTDLSGKKTVRIQTKCVRLTNAKAVPAAPYLNPEHADSVIAAGGFPVLVLEPLATVYAHTVKDDAAEGDAFAKALYAAPGDPVAWAVYADHCEEQGKGKIAALIREWVGTASTAK